MRNPHAHVRRLIEDDSGATMLEYVLTISLVAAACVVAVTAFGGGLGAAFTGFTEMF